MRFVLLTFSKDLAVSPDPRPHFLSSPARISRVIRHCGAVGLEWNHETGRSRLLVFSRHEKENRKLLPEGKAAGGEHDQRVFLGGHGVRLVHPVP